MTEGPLQGGPQVAPVSSQTVIRTTQDTHSYSRSVYDVHQEFGQLEPERISDACRAWKRAADELLVLAEGLKAQAATPLHAAWSSPASPAAQQQLQVAEATARALANDCMQMAHATDYAAQYADWYKKNLPSYTDALASGAKGMVTGQGLSGGADAATAHLVNLMSRYNEVVSILPAAVRAQVIESSAGYDDMVIDPSSGGVGGSPQAPSIGGHGSAVPGGAHSLVPGVGSGRGTGVSGLGSGAGGAGLSGGGGVGSGTPGPGSGVGDPYAAGSTLAGSGLGGGLAGFDPNALGTATAGGGGGGGGLGAGFGAGALGAAGLGAGGLAGGLGAGRLGAGAGGAGSVAGQGVGGPAGVAGLGGGGVGVGGEGVGVAGAGRGGVMPMHGAGGHGAGEEERERSSWLMEEDDVWDTGGDVPPPVITS